LLFASVGIAVDLVSWTGSGASPLCPNGPGARAAASAAKHKRRPRIALLATTDELPRKDR